MQDSSYICNTFYGYIQIMDINEIQTIYRQIEEKFESNELKTVINLLIKLLQKVPDERLSQQLEACNINYRYLLQYAVTGNEDPTRDSILNKLRNTLAQIADQAYEGAMNRYASSLYYTEQRMQKALEASTWTETVQTFRTHTSQFELAEESEKGNIPVDLQQKHEQLMAQLFYKAWLFPCRETDSLRELLVSGPEETADLLVSALYLRLLQRFEETGFELLLDAYTLRTDAVRWKALCDLAVITYRYEKKIMSQSRLIQRIMLLQETDQFNEALKAIILQFIMSQETESIGKKMRDEIIPEMMKFKPAQGHFNPEELFEEMNGNENDPKWSNFSKFSEKMQEINELQMKGADTMMASFAPFKQHAFFGKIHNWFLPFMPSYSLLQPLRQEEAQSGYSILKMLARSSFICDSDRYSFCLSLLQIPGNYQNMLRESIKANSEQLKLLEESGHEQPVQNNQEAFRTVVRLHIQNRYRFHKLHPRRGEFPDIFNQALELHRSALLFPLIDHEVQLDIEASYLQQKYYDKALEILLQQPNGGITEHDAQIYQQIGYCRQMTGDYDKALTAYLAAHTISERHLWTLRRIAECYFQLGRYNDSLSFLLLAEQQKPDNLSIEINKGNCQMKLKAYEEALKSYFKVEFLNPQKGERIWRPIAWCCFMCGKYDEAARYYEKIIQKGGDRQDYLNAGHVQWVTQHTQEALDFYQKSIRCEGSDIETVIELIKHDQAVLTEKGILPEDLFFMTEYLRYQEEL